MAGCAGTPVIRKPVIVHRNVFVPVPAILTRPCPVASPRNDSGAELLRVARARKAALQACSARLRLIGLIQGKAAP